MLSTAAAVSVKATLTSGQSNMSQKSVLGLAVSYLLPVLLLLPSNHISPSISHHLLLAMSSTEDMHRSTATPLLLPLFQIG